MKRALWAGHRLGIGAMLALTLAGCAGGGNPPTAGGFNPARFFDGKARSHGTITTALVSKENFTADFDGRVVGGTLVLDERFHFADGERLQRWRLRPEGGGRYGGTVETEGKSGALHPPVPVTGASNAAGAELSYDGYAPGGDMILHFRHRMAYRSDDTVLNRVRISKYGLPLAGATVVFEKGAGAGEMR